MSCVSTIASENKLGALVGSLEAKAKAAGARAGVRVSHVRAVRGKMTFIDSALLNLTEWFCRQFQVLTGRTNVWLAVQFTNLNIIVSTSYGRVCISGAAASRHE